MDNALNDITNKVHSYAVRNIITKHFRRHQDVEILQFVTIFAQELIANAYSFFKNKWPELGPPIDVTAACLGINRVSVMQYKGGPTDFQSIRRKRPKLSTTDLDQNRKEEIRRVIYQMYKESKLREELLRMQRRIF